MYTVRLAMVSVLFLLSGAIVTSAQQPSDLSPDERDRILGMLGDGSPDERGDAVLAIQRIPVEERDRDILQALTAEATRLAAQLEERGKKLDEGEQVGPWPYPEMHLRDVLELLAESHDSRVIPALFPFITTGSIVQSALASFGEPALEYLFEAVAVNDEPANVLRLNAAFYTLQIMLDGESGSEPLTVRNPISSASRQRIEDVAWQWLTPERERDPWIVGGVTGLAVATGNPGLIERVSALAIGDATAQPLDLMDPADLARIQRQAAEALDRGGVQVR